MGSTILYCVKCTTGYASIGEVPTRCPACDRITSWTTTIPVMPGPEPKIPWKVGINDKRFLRSIRIASSEEDA